MKLSVNMCSLPLELPPSRVFLLGWNAVMEHTVVRWSMFRKVWRWRPLSWYTWIRRGLSTLPITKQSCCLGSHTALSLDNHRPVCMLCLHRKYLACCYNGSYWTKMASQKLLEKARCVRLHKFNIMASVFICLVGHRFTCFLTIFAAIFTLSNYFDL